jgi:hypothetical protein
VDYPVNNALADSSKLTEKLKISHVDKLWKTFAWDVVSCLILVF